MSYDLNSVPEVGLSGAKVVVTGAGGAIGSRLVKLIAGHGARVIAIDLYPPQPDKCIPSVEYVSLDISDSDSIRGLVAGADVVFHLAYLMGEEANSDPVAAARINTLGGTQLMQSCIEAKVGRVVMASSITVFGSARDYLPVELPLADNARQLGAKGIPVYGMGKVYLETVARHLAHKSGVPICGVRPGAVIGVSRKTGRAKSLANIVAAAEAGRHVVVDNGLAAFQAIHVDDVAGAFAHLAGVDRNALAEAPFVNLAGDYATMRSYCDEVADLLPQASFGISDGDSDELFGSAACVLDEAIHSRVGFERKYKTLREAILAELNDIKLDPRQGGHARASGMNGA